MRSLSPSKAAAVTAEVADPVSARAVEPACSRDLRRGLVGGLRRGLAATLAVASLATTAPAWALQPLEQFVRAADDRNPDAREALALTDQRDAEARAALGRILPAFTARGLYTHNQYEAAAQIPVGGETRTLIIQPQNQWDAFLQLDVPLVDMPGYARWKAQQAGADAAAASEEVTHLELRKRVVRSYYTVLGAEAFVRSAKNSLAVAERNRDVVRMRKLAQLVSDLDVERAEANVERAKQDIADAELASALAKRVLESVTRLTPEAVTDLPEDDLHEEAPLATWLATSPRTLPQGKAAEAQVRAAEASARASKLALLPTLSASAQERFTNATGFTGRDSFYTLQATLSWRLDYATVANIDAQKAASQAAEARDDRTLRSAQDDIFEAWQRVQAGIAKSRAARAQAQAASRAAQLSQDRYATGAATQLDVTQAQRDAFDAQIARIRADAELVSARAVLRLSAGRPFSDASPSRTP